ncbi:chromate transporter [Peribacillus alkalitolerans]|uniref:chromate transporter n=1 Tax=Peribacillus alkalitolerans TaxID=1550385 RepID=UPI0013D3BFB3|nr:chromate transporter [Peribacillus alkalitolerans]
MILWALFKTFFLVGIGSFGGGLGMVSVIEFEVINQKWMTSQELTNIIAVAGMSPGPFATNCAILVGYHTNGLTGAIVSTLGILLPSFILVLLVAICFKKLNQYQIVQSMFYGLRPIITSLIIFAAIKLVISNNLVVSSLSLKSISIFLIFTFSLISLLKFKWHPVFVLLISGFIGYFFNI